MIFIKRT